MTPDSDGKEVYYYMVQARAPFTIGCFGPVASVAACRALYSECDGANVCVETEYGRGLYDLDCPCFDEHGSNVDGNTEVPGFMQGGTSSC